MRILANLILISLCLHSPLYAQLAKSYSLGVHSISSGSLPASNSTNEIVVSRDTIWFGTDKGLCFTADNGSSFTSFANTNGFETKGISAIALNDGIIWVATATSFKQDNQSIPAGGGLYFSTNRGMTWMQIPQPVDAGLVDTLQYGVNRIKTLAITTTANNLSYDLALTSNAVWSANFAGMLRKSTDRGTTWQRVVLPPDTLDHISPNDTLDFDLSPSGGKSGLRQNLNHRVFSVAASNDTTLWVGTAGGINKSTDGGVSWKKFSHQNQLQGISGNFVVAISIQRSASSEIIWAATVNAESRDERRGVSFSEDGGATWKTTLLGEFTHNIGFKDSIAYVATDNGIFRSSDRGVSWTKSGTVNDNASMQRLTSGTFYAVASKGDTVWIAGPDGIAWTLDSPTTVFGSSWKVLRTYVPVGTSSKTYSYPLPFSPNQEVVRIHYSLQAGRAPVTIRVFDFAMKPVRTLIQNASRPGGVELDDIWDGTDDNHRRVANGVYFYKIEIEGAETLWGKIFVLL